MIKTCRIEQFRQGFRCTVQYKLSIGVHGTRINSNPAGICSLPCSGRAIIFRYMLIGLIQQIAIYCTGAVAPLALPMGELSAEQAD